mmetsp:Transcript_11686/g.37111  ORF Transcript_11686/g.37111 Transcript_11686/m.37111 type:complete len:398 (+) Transcript_11686:384-1577(+)
MERLLDAVRVGLQLHHAVQGHFEVRDLLQGLVHEVGVEGPQHGLVGDDHHRGSLPFKLDEHGLQALNHIQIALPARVPVPQLVLLPRVPLPLHRLLDLQVRHPIAHPRVDLVEGAPLHLRVVVQVTRRLGGAAHRRRPHGTRLLVHSLVNEVCEDFREFFAIFREPRVAADPPVRIEFALTVAGEEHRPRSHMAVDKIEHDASGQVPGDAVHLYLPLAQTVVNQLDVRHVLLTPRLHRVSPAPHGLVRCLVVDDPSKEIRHPRVEVLGPGPFVEVVSAGVVGRPRHLVTHVAEDLALVEADGLEKDDLAIPFAQLHKHVPSRKSGVGGVIYPDLPPRLHPLQHVEAGHAGHLLPRLHPRRVVGVEEIRALRAAVEAAAVLANVEVLGVVPQPAEILA